MHFPMTVHVACVLFISLQVYCINPVFYFFPFYPRLHCPLVTIKCDSVIRQLFNKLLKQSWRDLFYTRLHILALRTGLLSFAELDYNQKGSGVFRFPGAWDWTVVDQSTADFVLWSSAVVTDQGRWSGNLC